MVDQRTEFEIALKDSITPQLQNIGKQLKEMNKLAKEAGEAHSGTVDKIRKSNEGMTASAREGLRHFKEVGETILDFGKDLLGVGGVVETIKQIGDGINEFATSTTQLKFFGENVNLATEEIESMRDAMDAMGIKTEQADKYISGLTGKLQQLQTFRESSPLYQDLAKMGPAGEKEARQLLAKVNAGDYTAAIEEILQFYQKQTPRAQAYLSEVFGWPQALLAHFEEFQKEINARLGERYQANEAASQQYMINKVLFFRRMENEWNIFADHALTDINKFWGDVNAQTKGSHAFSDWMNAEWDLVTKTIAQDIKDFEALKSLYEKAKELLQKASNTKMPSAWDWLGWGTPAEAQEHQQEKQDNTKAGNKALQDIDRILKDMYGGLTADPTGGFGGAHGGALQAGGGGFRPGRAGRAQGEATTTTDADGTKTTTAPDGSKTITKPDGTVTTTPPAPDSEQGRAEGMPSPQVDVSGKQAVAGGAAPAGSSYNYFQRHGHPMPFEASELKSIQTPYGPVTANPQALADIKGLTDELKKAGAPIKKLGSYNPRPKRWGGGYSSHGMGAAWDIDDAESLSPAMQRWIRENPEKWAQAKERWNIGQPLPEKDAPHLEWRGPHGSKLIDDPSDANAARKRVDDKASKSIWDQPSVDLRVQFKNVPPGVKTDADADGPLINQVTVDHSKAVPKQATQ